MIRTCQYPDCAMRLRPRNPGPFCFRHGGTQPERIDVRSAPAPAPRPGVQAAKSSATLVGSLR